MKYKCCANRNSNFSKLYLIFLDLNIDGAVVLPPSLKPVFASIRKEFAIAFSNIREAINANPPPLEELKRFLKDSCPHLKSQVVHCNSIDDILDIVYDHCTLMNISCLEGIVKRFKIKEAETHIRSYKDVIQLFIERIKTFALNESSKVTKIPSLNLLKCETAIFVLDWDPTDCTLEDIRDILAESVEGNVQIRLIREGK